MIEIGVLVIFVAIFLLVLGLVWRDDSLMEARIATLRGENTVFEFGNQPARESFSSRLVLPLADTLADSMERLLPTRWIQSVEQGLVRAGQPVTLPGFLVGSAVTLAFVVGLAAALVFSSGMGMGRGVLILGAAAGVGFYLPRIWLSNRARHRQKEILKSLPDAFDLVTVCVEAGLGLEASLARVAEKVEGPFGEELALSLREVSMGKLRRDSLKELAERTGVPDLTTFINAVVQAESMGTSIATVLRVQADQLRIRRRQRAEQQAMAAPIKMMFPLVLCIFPTLFIVILGPAGMALYEQLVKRG